jgi:hypothetical protein
MAATERLEMLRLIALTLLAAIAAPAGLAGEQGERNRGQSVSDCNYQAKARRLQGQDRKDFVDGCVTRYGNELTDDERRNRYRDCHASAADRGLHDATRRQYIEDCVESRLPRRTIVMLGG